MINSVFILNDLGDVIAEKHWRGLIGRGICDALWDAVTRADSVLDVPPIIAAHTGQHHLFNVVHFVTKPQNSLSGGSASDAVLRRDAAISRAAAAATQKVFFVAVAATDVNVMVPLEFLHRMVDVFEDYFGVGFGEADLQDGFARVYMLLEEMADNGDPSCTEAAILRAFVPPPHMLGSLGEKFTGKKDDDASAASDSSMNVSGGGLPGLGGGGGGGSGAISVPWRRTGIKYTTNEFFLDIVEDVDCIVEASGNVVTAAVAGNMYANCKLSGMPDLTLSFVNPALLDDVSLHPCVRVFRWEKSRIISFVPPDGKFKLMSYRVRGSGVVPPVAIRPVIKFDPVGPATMSSSSYGGSTTAATKAPTCTTGKMDVTVSPRLFGNPKNVVDDLVVTIPLPRTATGVLLTVTAGTFDYDARQRVVVWTIGKWNAQLSQVSISGTISLAPGSPVPEACPPISAHFKIQMYTASGIRVDSLDVQEQYKPYKGVRSVTRGGQYFFRT